MPHKAKNKREKINDVQICAVCNDLGKICLEFLLNVSCTITKTNIIMIMRYAHKAKTRISLDVRTEQVKVNRNGSSIGTLL